MTTNNENNILKEQLQQVDLPDVDQAWAQMEDVLDSTPPSAGIASNFLGGFKFYLNLFVGAVLLSAVGFYVASKPTEPTTPTYISEAELSDKDAQLGSYLTDQITKNHEGDLPTPGFVLKFIPMDLDLNFPMFNGDQWIYQQPFYGCGTSALSNSLDPQFMLNQMRMLQGDSSAENTTTSDTAPAESVDTTELALNTKITDETITLIEDEDLYGKQVDGPTRRRSQVGLKVQTSLLPQPSGANLKNTLGASVFARKFITNNTAVFIELGFNPQAIAPTPYVEQFNVFNKVNYTQRDSATVRNLNYVSIPVGIHYQLSDKWSLSGGAQFSFLTGMKGDLITDLNYPGAPVENESYTDTYIMNRGGFNRTDLSLIAEVAYQAKRFELGLRMQQGLSDYTAQSIGESYNQLQALQFRASWLINN